MYRLHWNPKELKMAKPAATVSSLQPYPAYKPSGVEWLGDVPAHWEVRRLKAGANNVVDPTTNRRPDEMYLALEHVESWTGRSRSAGPDIGLEGQLKRFEAGDVLFGKLRPYLAKVAHPGRSGVCVGEFLVLRPRTRGLDANYLSRLLRSKRAIDTIDASTFGAKMPRAEWAFIGGLECPLPPHPEQAAIARFLDHADRRVLRCIHAKEKLVKLLEEQKQAIIRQAVTGQIDVQTGEPHPAYKPSGVQWLGDVPRHWRVVSLKWISHRSQNGATPPTSQPLYYEEGTIPWYGPSSCGPRDQVGAPVRYLTEAAFLDGSARLIRGPALLLVVIGATAGRMAIMPNDGATNQQITAFEVSTDFINPKFLLRQLRQAEHWLRSTASTATIPILDSGIVTRLLCAVPPRAEQDVIDRVLDANVARIDITVDRYLTEIALLREYLTRLTADVVTGALDVRGEVARVSDEVEDLESTAGSAVQTDIGHGSDREVNAAAQGNES